MPYAPQVPNTPVDVANTANITAATAASGSFNYTIDANPGFAVGDVIWVNGFPSTASDLNGQFTITAISSLVISVAGTTTQTIGSLTDYPTMVGIGNSTAGTDYDTSDITQVYPADTEDLAVVNAAAASAYAAAQQAESDAQTAISNANTALNNSVAAGQQAQSAALAASQAQTTANGKNKVTYSYSTPGSTANTAGDIWFQYGSSGAQLNKIIAQWAGLGGTSWQSTFVDGLNIANINAGNITTGIITAAIGINNPSGNFSVDGATGVLRATGAIIDGNLTVRNGTFVGTVTSSTATITGTLYINNIVATGTVYALSGYIGDPTNGWNFSSSGYIYSNDFATILYPKSSQSSYALITDRSVAGAKLQATSSSSDALNVLGGGTIGGTLTVSYLSISGTVFLSAGYGVTTGWSPNTDNYNYLGLSANRWKAVYAANGTIQTSDARLKTDVIDTPLGLDFIKSLRPVAYKWINGGKEVEHDADGNPIIEGTDANGKPIFKTTDQPGKRLHYGFLAQEVHDAVVAAGVEDFAGWVLEDLNDPNSQQSLAYHQFIAPLIKAVQQLSNEVDLLKGNK